MKYSVKKLTAWILTLMMLISSMPVDALASIGTIRQENEIIDISDAVQVYGDLVTNKVTSRDGFSVKVESHKKDLPVNGEVKFRTLRMAKAVTPVADGGRRELGSYDIEIWNNDLNEEWQPEAGETVDVTVSLPAPLDVNKGEKLYLIHDPEGRNEDVHATFYVKNDQVTGFSFKATGFSVYAVVAAPDPDALLHVVFKYNAEANAEQIADMYVKQSDNMNQVLFDPSGLIEKDDEAIFKGWTTDPNYTVDTAALTMDNIRAAVEGKFPLTAEDTEVVYYPILVKQYTINYLDPNAVSLGMHTIDLRADDNDPKPYTIEMAYTPQDDTHSFEGWNVVSGDEYIAAAEGGTLPEPPYPNKTNVTVSGNVTFQVESPEGSWLIFHQNGKGGTYNAPQFLQYEDLLEDVSILPMTRRGYTFGGWYTDAACTDGNEFVFEGTIETRTEIYAKWIPNEEAAYTVVFWTQNLSRTGYEVGASYVKTKAQVGTIIPYSFVDNVDEDYVTSPDFGNSMGHFTGFCLTENSKNQQVTIEPEGDTVLNLYYDRIVYNFKFYLYRDADQNNRYDYANNSGGGSDLNGVVTWHSNQTQKPSVTGYTEQSETVNGRTYHYFVMQAYYGEDISSKWPTYDKITGANGRDAVSFVMMVGTVLKPSATTSGSGTVKGVISVLNENILGATNNANGNYVVIRFPGSYYNWRYHIWFEAVDGEDYTGKTLRTYNGRTYYEETVMEVRSSNTEVSSQNEPKYTGFDFVEKRGQNWNNSNYWTTGNNPTLYHLNYVYNRQEFKISYFDGEYVNGDNGHMANHSGVLLHESPDIGQGATIADEYKNYKPTQSSEPGYTFDGWYLDEACTTPYVWGTMPVGGIKVYAKWRQIQYRVFLQMNPPAEGVEVDWGSSVINDNFRKEIGGSVSVYTGIAAGYAFVGWYNHKDGSLFDADITSLDDSITEEYPLDEKRAYGDGNRFWINRKLVLYPKWRVALVGADGINVVYDREDPAVGGTGTIKGGKYVDTAEANAIPGVAAPKAGYQFAYWIMKKPDGSEYEDPIYAGQPFTVLAENAVEERLVDENGNAIYVQDAQGHYLDENGKIIDEGAPGWENDRIQRREYTITLRAKYIPIEGPASTHISWFMNDGTEAFHTDGDEEHPLQVNVGVDVQNAPARDGYQFIGWAFVPEDGADSETWESNSENWTQNLTEPDIYYQDGHYYKKDTETEITQIAADENLPYDAVFAVWQPILKVEITGNKDTKTYNGSEQSVTGFTVKYKVGDGDWTTTAPEGVSVALASGKAAEAKGTDVDTYPMGLDKTFFTVNPGNNVFNAEEDLTVTDGELEITPASVTLTANSDTKTYTGTEQTATGYTCSVEGLSFTGVSASGSGTNVGEYDVTFEGVTINETKDSTGNYVVTGTTDGKLIINPAPVTIKTGSDEKEYDGTPLTKAEASITGLVNNETATVTATGSQTEVGSSTNTYSIDWGTTNKDNYTVTEDLGTLTVTANTAEVTLTAPSDEKTYDGTALTCDGTGEKKVTASGLPEGFTVEATASGSQTDAGTSANVVNDGYVIKNAEGVDKTANFTNVKKADGTLTVNPVPVTIKTGSDEKEYDGTPLTKAEASITGLVNNETATVTATGSQTEVGSSTNTYSIDWGTTNKDNYTVTEDLGTLTVTANTAEVTLTAPSDEKTYDGTALTCDGTGEKKVTASGLPEGFTVEATASGSQTDAGTSANVVNDGYIIKDADGNDKTTDFTNVKKINGTLTVNPAPVTIKTGSDEKEYDGTPLTKAEASITGLVNNETATVTATGSQTEVGSSTNTYSIEWGTTNKDNYTVTEDLGTLTVTANTAEVTLTAPSDEKTYDGTALTCDGTGEKKVTASGLPEGFTVEATASGSQTDAGTSANVVNDGYVIKNAEGVDKTANFTNVKKADGTLTVNPAPVTIKTGSDEKEYDGTPLTKAEASITGLVNNETATVTATGSQTEVGSSTNTYSIDWGTTNKDNYTVTEDLGTLTVTANTAEVTLTAPSDEKTYDGTALTCDGTGEKKVTASGLPEGFTVEATASGSQTDAGTSANVVNDGYVIKNAEGVDKTANFTNVKKADGTLTVNPAPVTIKTGSDEKEYDGTPLTKAEASITGLVNNETATVTATGSQTEVGSSTNTYSIDWGTTNKDNYTVTEDLGTLTVTANTAEVTLTAPSDEKTYDGTALTCDGTGEKKVTASGLPEGFTVEATASGSQTDAGTSANVVNDGYVIKNAEGVDKTANFTNVKKADGTLTVNPAPVTIKTGSDEKEYDGTPLTKAEASITGLVNNETATVTATGSQTEVGSSTNTYSIDWGTTNKDNYTVTEDLGTLTVTANTAEVTLTAPSDEKTYDGTALTCDGTGEKKVTASGLPEGFTVEATASGSQTDAGTSANVVNDGYVIKNAEGVDKTANFTNVKKADGTLTVKARTVILTSQDGEKPYDGTPLTKPNVTVSGDGFVEGEATDIKATGSVTTVAEGEVTNTITYTEGTNFKADNYTITKNEGTLKINPITDKVTVTITENSDEATYDGVAHEIKGYKTMVADNDLYDVETSVKETETADWTVAKTDAGTYDMGIVAGDFENTNPNFTTVEFVIMDGQLKISKRTVIMTSATDSKVYDSTPLTNDEVKETGDGFVDGEGADYDVTGTQTLVGESDNTFTYTLKDGTKADNYTITTAFGVLTVTDENVPDDLVVKKTADDTVYALGEEVTFDIWVKNIYDDTVTIKLIEIEGVTLAKDTFEGVKPGEEITTTATYTITEADILAGSFTNTVTAKVVEKEWSAKADVKVEEPNASLKVTKKTTSTPADGKAYVLDETITYEITVENDGNLTLTDVTVIDEKTGDKWTVDSLAPGATETFTAEYVVTETDILAGSVKNDVTATGNPPDDDIPDPEDEDEVEDPTEEPKASLKVNKETTSTPADGKAYVLDEKITYKITVKNDGNLTLTNVVVTDELTGDEWTIDTMKPGDSKEFEAEYIVTEADVLAGSVKNSVTAKGNPPDDDIPDPEEEDEVEDPTEDPNGHITIEKVTTSKSANPKGYVEGETIAYKITVKNDGNLTITEITVTDELTGDEWKIDSMAPGEEKEYETSYTVTAEDVEAGEVLNVATGTGKSPDPKNPEVPVTPGKDPEPTTEDKYTLTIEYIYQDGRTAAETYTEVLHAGDAYDVQSPYIAGYYASQHQVTGTMPARDVMVTVIYVERRNTITIDDFVTPLGIGLGSMNAGETIE